MNADLREPESRVRDAGMEPRMQETLSRPKRRGQSSGVEADQCAPEHGKLHYTSAAPRCH